MAGTELLSVGRLGRRTGLTAKALRHYDRIGLLRPAFVDDAGASTRAWPGCSARPISYTTSSTTDWRPA